MFAIAMNVILPVIAFQYIPESPKWLYSKSRFKQCYQSLKHAATWNRVKVQPLAFRLVSYSAKPGTFYDAANEKDEETGWKFVKRHKHILNNLVIMTM